MKYVMVGLFFCGIFSLASARLAPYEVIEHPSVQDLTASPKEGAIVASDQSPLSSSAPLKASSIKYDPKAAQLNQLEEKVDELSTQLASLLGNMERVEHQQDLTAKTLAETLETLKTIQKKLDPALQKKGEVAKEESREVLPHPKKLEPREDIGKTAESEDEKPEADLAAEAHSEEDIKKIYQDARALISAGKYEQAETALLNFIKNYAEHELAGPAKYWLGETYFVQKKYTQATVTFADGYKAAPKGIKAPDNLLKLAMSLKELGKTKEACTTIKELLKHTNAPDALLNKAKAFKAKLPACN